MFRDPGRFSTYLLASPTINPKVLADEPAFFEKVGRSHMVLRVLITVGGDEQPPGAKLPYPTIDDASNLAKRLRAGAPWLEVEFTTFSVKGTCRWPALADPKYSVRLAKGSLSVVEANPTASNKRLKLAARVGY